ncbi:MAG TPA: anti-anti-sigma factor [Xanthomonadales bacterium]|nr:anti-anti-sigma factor [Xanthomonadales bacterium]
MAAVDLGPDLGIEAAAQLKSLLEPHLKTRRSVVLSADDVSRIHGASMQLLYAFVRERTLSGRKTRLDGADPKLVAAARTLGMTETLGLEDAR